MFSRPELPFLSDIGFFMPYWNNRPVCGSGLDSPQRNRSGWDRGPCSRADSLRVGLSLWVSPRTSLQSPLCKIQLTVMDQIR